MPPSSAVQMESPNAEATDGTAISARKLGREFGELVALRDVSLSLQRGETLTVLGPNGAGKSTLLRILATLLRPSGGAVEVLGAPLPREAWRLRGRIGYLGHDALLYRDLTVSENLGFAARLHRIEAPAQRVQELIAAVGLARRAEELVRNLSAGMVQRAAICRTVLHEPEILLLDEPRSHLDPEAAALVEPLVGAAGGRTRTLVTHDIEAGLAEGDRALVLAPGGAVAYEGPADGISAGDTRSAYGGAA